MRKPDGVATEGAFAAQNSQLTRSSLHRRLVRHGISRLPVNETMTKRGRFAETKIGYVHIDHCDLRHADGKLRNVSRHRSCLEVHLRRVLRRPAR